MIKVKAIMPINNQLLKKPSNTFIWFVSFLLLIWLNICMKTKVWKIIV